jgi:hypothetical protein
MSPEGTAPVPIRDLARLYQGWPSLLNLWAAHDNFQKFGSRKQAWAAFRKPLVAFFQKGSSVGRVWSAFFAGSSANCSRELQGARETQFGHVWVTPSQTRADNVRDNFWNCISYRHFFSSTYHINDGRVRTDNASRCSLAHICLCLPPRGVAQCLEGQSLSALIRFIAYPLSDACFSAFAMKCIVITVPNWLKC